MDRVRRGLRWYVVQAIAHWSWKRTAGCVGFLGGLYIVRDYGYFVFDHPLVRLKPSLTPEGTPVYENTPFPYPENKEVMRKHLEERKMYDRSKEKRVKPQVAKYLDEQDRKTDKIVSRLREEVAQELVETGDYASRSVIPTAATAAKA